MMKETILEFRQCTETDLPELIRQSGPQIPKSCLQRWSDELYGQFELLSSGKVAEVEFRHAHAGSPRRWSVQVTAGRDPRIPTLVLVPANHAAARRGSGAPVSQRAQESWRRTVLKQIWEQLQSALTEGDLRTEDVLAVFAELESHIEQRPGEAGILLLLGFLLGAEQLRLRESKHQSLAPYSRTAEVVDQVGSELHQAACSGLPSQQRREGRRPTCKSWWRRFRR